MKFNKFISELSVTNFNSSIEFYTTIGFHIVYERPENIFSYLELDGNQ